MRITIETDTITIGRSTRDDWHAKPPFITSSNRIEGSPLGGTHRPRLQDSCQQREYSARSSRSHHRKELRKRFSGTILHIWNIFNLRSDTVTTHAHSYPMEPVELPSTMLSELRAELPADVPDRASMAIQEAQHAESLEELSIDTCYLELPQALSGADCVGSNLNRSFGPLVCDTSLAPVPAELFDYPGSQTIAGAELANLCDSNYFSAIPQINSNPMPSSGYCRWSPIMPCLQRGTSARENGINAPADISPISPVTSYYTAKSRRLVLTPNSSTMVQVTNSENIARRMPTQKSTFSRRIICPSNAPARTISARGMQALIDQMPFAKLLSTGSLRDDTFHRSVQEYHNVRKEFVERARPRHRFRRGKPTASGRGSILRLAYPTVRCERCPKSFRGQDRKRRLVCHRQEVHVPKLDPEEMFPNDEGMSSNVEDSSIFSTWPDFQSSQVVEWKLAKPGDDLTQTSQFPDLCKACGLKHPCRCSNKATPEPHIMTAHQDSTDPPFPPVMCQHCEKIFSGKFGSGNMKRHVRQKHEGVHDHERHMCEVCLKTYNRAGALRDHLWKKHRVKDAKAGWWITIGCSVCAVYKH